MATARIAVSATKFATVDIQDWGFAYYAGEWRLTAGVVRCGCVTLERFVANRMGLDRAITVAHRDDDPLNCTRGNLYSTPYVWVRGEVTRHFQAADGETEDRTQRGWLFGNVGLVQDGGTWMLIHRPTGLYTGAGWPRVSDAKDGTELIHAEADLAELDKYETFTLEQGRHWRRVLRERMSWRSC
jgi:hypothetical protein